MAGTGKFLDIVDGVPTQKEAISTSAGAADVDEIPKLDAAGKLDQSMMPVGIGADTASLIASETLIAGDLVNVWDDAAVSKVRKADASAAGKEANGFVLAAVTSGNAANVYFEGQNNQLTGLTLGASLYLSAATAGAVTATPPSGSGNIVQRVGKVVSATLMSFEPAQPITLV